MTTMDVSIGQVQARVESQQSGGQSTAPERGQNKGTTQKNHEARLEARRAKRIHDRLAAK